jgi:hypothetical protein
MVEAELMQTLHAMAYVTQMVGVAGTLIAAFIGVRTYINTNKRTEEAKHKEQETRDHDLQTKQAQMFMNIYNQVTTKEFSNILKICSKHQ